MNRKQILRNALTTFGQVIGSAGTLFLLYRFLIRTIGAEKLGIWSLVLATTSVVTLANQGFSTGVVKFVAKYAARRQSAEISRLLETALISLGVALGLLSIIFYPGAKWILKLVVPSTSVAEAYAILPYAVASLWVNILGSILQSGLVGFELVTHRNYVVLGGSVVYLFLCYGLVPNHGLAGLAYAQTAQAAGCYMAAWLLLRRQIPQFPFIPWRWDRSLFRETAAYGLHFQFITTSQAVREPVTKALLAKFGGLALTGYYDMALRWVVTFRELLVQANQVLVPTVSGLQERDAASIPKLYRESYRLMFFLAIPTFALLVIASPIVSRIWVGRYEPSFVHFVALLAMGWLVNSLSNPAYVVDLGTGALRWVTVGCAATAVLNVAAGFAVGRFIGGTAIVAASALSLAAGYAIVVIAYHREHSVPFGDLLPRESRPLVGATLAGTALLPLLCFLMNRTEFFVSRVAAACAACVILMLGGTIWTHPLRKRLLSWVSS